MLELSWEALEDAGIVPAGHFEIEPNYSGDAQGTSFDLVHGSNLILKSSLTDHLQLQLATARQQSRATHRRKTDVLKFVMLVSPFARLSRPCRTAR